MQGYSFPPVSIGVTVSSPSIGYQVQDFPFPGTNGPGPYSPFQVPSVLRIDEPAVEMLFSLFSVLHAHRISQSFFELIQLKESWVFPGHFSKISSVLE